MLVALPCETKRARERGKTRNNRGKEERLEMTEGTIITEQEVRNQRAMINDTILVGKCSGYHQH